MPVLMRVNSLLALVVFAVSCTSVSKDPNQIAQKSSSSATVAIFAPKTDACQSVLPFPIDLVKDPATGLLSNIPDCSGETEDQKAVKAGLRTLDGFSINATLTVNFSKPINTDSLREAIKVYNAQTGELVDVTLIPAQNNTVFIAPKNLLNERTTYIAVVTGQLKDAEGNAVISDQSFVFLKSQEPLADQYGHSRFSALSDGDASAMERIRQAYLPVFAGLARLGIERQDIAVAWFFTTQTVHSLGTLAAQVSGVPTVKHGIPIPAADYAENSGLPDELKAQLKAALTGSCQIHTGQIELKNFLADDTGMFRPYLNGAAQSATISVPYTLITPKERVTLAECKNLNEDPWTGEKLVVFAHGLGRCKSDVIGLALAFAQEGYAVLAFDGPYAGQRSVNYKNDQDLDGCPDQPAIPEFITQGATTNPVAVGDHLREWALEIAQVVHAAKESPLLFANRSDAKRATDVAVVGHSWGGIATALASSVLTKDEVDAIVVNAAGADFGAIFEPLIQGSISLKLSQAGVPLNTDSGKELLAQNVKESLGYFTWALNDADPIYATGTNIPFLTQVISLGTTDTLLPSKLHGLATQEILQKAFSSSLDQATLKNNTFDLFDECKTAEAAIGAMLTPCDFASYDKIQSNLVAFICKHDGAQPSP